MLTLSLASSVPLPAEAASCPSLASTSAVHSSSVTFTDLSAFSTIPLSALYNVVTYWLLTICNSLGGGASTIYSAPALLIASEIYSIFCIPPSRLPSKAENAAGIRVTSPPTSARRQSSTKRMFSASLFHAAHSAVTERSRAAPTRALRRSTAAPSGPPRGAMVASSAAPAPMRARSLER